MSSTLRSWNPSHSPATSANTTANGARIADALSAALRKAPREARRRCVRKSSSLDTPLLKEKSFGQRFTGLLIHSSFKLVRRHGLGLSRSDNDPYHEGQPTKPAGPQPRSAFGDTIAKFFVRCHGGFQLILVETIRRRLQHSQNVGRMSLSFETLAPVKNLRSHVIYVAADPAFFALRQLSSITHARVPFDHQCSRRYPVHRSC